MESSPLFKKKISFNGDSISNGAGFAGGYGKIIAERNEMEYENISVGGATIAAETYNPAGVKRHSVSRSIEGMSADSDYAIVEGGVNDSSLFVTYGAPRLGEISRGYNAPLDDTTFCGAFESMLKQLTLRFAGKKIGYIIVHKMSAAFTPEYGEENNFYLAAIRCCEKWGVPYLDLSKSIPPFAFFKQDGNPELYALRCAYTKNGDGWHPNEDGYKKYYCDKIEAWLKTL